MKQLEPVPELEHKTNKKIQVPKSIQRTAVTVLTAVLLLVVLVSLCFAWFSGRSNGKRTYEQIVADLKAQVAEQDSEISGLNEKIETLKEAPMVVSTIVPEISLDVIKTQMHSISELTTYEYLFTNSGKFSNSKTFHNRSIPLTEKSFILKWNGVIKAGIDISDVAITVDKENAAISIRIPPAKITSYSVDKENMEILDENSNIFNKITVKDVTNFDAATETEMCSRAVERGLLEKAQQQAEYVIRNFLLSLPDIQEFYTLEFQFAENP